MVRDLHMANHGLSTLCHGLKKRKNLRFSSLFLPAGTLGVHIEQYSKLVEKKFEEEEIRHVVRQAGNGLAFLHEQMLVHLDVKPGVLS